MKFEEKLKIKHVDPTIIKKIMSLESSISSRNHTGNFAKTSKKRNWYCKKNHKQ